MKTLLQRLGIIAMILGLFVDLVAFFRIFGVENILSPVLTSLSLQDTPILLKQPTDIETLTFLIWLYSSIILLIVARRLTHTHPSIPLILSTTPASMLLVWSWGFGYIVNWLYIFSLPIVGFISMSWFAASMVHQAYNRALIVLSLIAVGLTILWFQASLTWPFPLIVFAATMSCMVGNGIGYGIGERDPDPISWITHGIRAFQRSR